MKHVAASSSHFAWAGAFFGVVAAGLVGCSGGPVPRQAADGASITTVTSFPPDLGRSPNIAISDATILVAPVEVRHTCAGLDPRFEFDSARLPTADTRGLRALAQCMKTGPLADKVVRLVGHADVRGPALYNENLARERAATVRLFLMQSGIDPDRIVIESRGKLDARPVADDWDRRVDIELMP